MRLAGWLLIVFSICAAAAAAQTGGGTQGNGAAFGTRNTRDCSLSEASPTGAQLQQAFICETEVYTPPGASQAYLTLVSDVALQFSKARRYNGYTDAFSGIDVTQPIFDVRGNFVQWDCYVPSTPVYGNAPVPGRNCRKSVGTGAHGIAFRDTFGTWHVKVCCTVWADGSNVVFYPPPTNQF